MYGSRTSQKRSSVSNSTTKTLICCLFFVAQAYAMPQSPISSPPSSPRVPTAPLLYKTGEISSHHHPESVADWIVNDEADRDIFPPSSNSDVSSSSQYDRLLTHDSNAPTCVPIPNNMSLCAGIGYSTMRVPNLLGHETMDEILPLSNEWLHLLTKGCHRYAQHFLCSLFAPICIPAEPQQVPGNQWTIWPCRELCVAVRDGCLEDMKRFGFSWPDMFDCDKRPFPQSRPDALCLSLQQLESKSASSSESVLATTTVASSTTVNIDYWQETSKVVDNTGLTPYSVARQIPPVPTPTIAPTTAQTTPSSPDEWLMQPRQRAKQVQQQHYFSTNQQRAKKSCTFCATSLNDKSARKMFCEADVVFKLKFRKLRQGVLYAKRARIFKYNQKASSSNNGSITLPSAANEWRPAYYNQPGNTNNEFGTNTNVMRNPLLHIVETALEQSPACVAQCVDTIQYGRQPYLVFGKFANNDTALAPKSGRLYDVENEDDAFEAFDEDEDETAAGMDDNVNIGVFDDFFHEEQMAQPQALALSSSGAVSTPPARRTVLHEQQTKSSVAKSSSPVLIITHFVTWQNHDRAFRRAVKRMKRARCPSLSSSSASNQSHEHRRHRHRQPAMQSSSNSFSYRRPSSSRSSISWLQI